MNNNDNVSKHIKIIASDHNDTGHLIKLHLQSLAYPMESWQEDNLLKSKIHKIYYKDRIIGYASIDGELLGSFHVINSYFRYAPVALEKIIKQKDIKKVFLISQDPLLNALLAEWDYEKEKVACIFSDCGMPENSLNIPDADPLVKKAVFRTAAEQDISKIREVSGDFFEEASGGFQFFEERIAAGTIFLLEEGGNLLGCGIIEKSLLNTGCVSIGMFVNRDFRKKGVARTILLNLKKWAYENNLKPVAGCWYYNTLSRKSLESAGMMATSIGYEAILKGKEHLPLRTGNPPGELVTD